MSLIRSVAELRNDNGRIRVADDGRILEVKIWNRHANATGFTIGSLEQFRELLDDWQQLYEQLDFAVTKYGGSSGEFVGYDSGSE